MLKKLNNFIRNSSSPLLPLGIIFLISVGIIMSWFRYGYIYGGGDVGLPTFDPLRILGIAKNIWWDVHAPGFPYPSALTAIPFSLMLIPLQYMGISHVWIQALFFGSLMFLMGAGMYFLFSDVTDSRSKTLSLIAALFYMLNPYMVMQVWHRFVHTAFFLAALLPLLTLIYIKIINTRKLYWFIIFLLTSLVFTYTFGSLSFIVVIWIPIVIYSLWKWVEDRTLKTFLWVFGTLGVLLLSWVLINFWWIYPFWTTGPAIYAQVHSIYESISTLISLSAKSTIPMVLRGVNPFYAFGDSAWVPGYETFFMQMISWLFPLVTLVGIYSILKNKNKSFYVWIVLFLVGVYISKGLAAPFGYPFLWLFSKSFFLGAFRNSYEKLGIIVPLASAFILPVGTETIFLWLKSRLKANKYIPLSLVLMLLVLLLGVYAWPMWLGKMFGSFKNPALVEVPESYKQADDWIKSQGKDGRILHLPFAHGDAVTYSWDRGYNGVEPSTLLFSLPSVSQGFGLEPINSSMGSINTVFSVKNFDENKVAKVLSGLNVRYIIVHNDTDWRTRKLIDPENLTNLLSKVNFIKKKAEFGDLDIYEIKDENYTAKLFTIDVSDVLTGRDRSFAIWPEIYEEQESPEIFISPVNGNENSLKQQSDLNYSMNPTRIIDIPPFPLAYEENALAELPSPRFLPDSPFYFLILLKEKIQLTSSPILSRHLLELDIAGKRLVETYRLKEKGNEKLAKLIEKRYREKLDTALDLINQKNNAGLINEVDTLDLKRRLARHVIVLNKMNESGELEHLRNKLSEMGLASYFDLIEENNMSKYGRKVFRFDVLKDGDYELLLKEPESRIYYKNNLNKVPVQINNEVKILETKERRDFLSLGKIKLNEGLNEISYNTIDSVNLVPKVNDSKWESKGIVKAITDQEQILYELSRDRRSETSLSFPITGFDKNSLYRIDFEYWVKSGLGPILQVEQNSDWDVDGERYMDINKLYDKDNYSFYWNSGSILFQPRPNTNEAVVKFVVKPWNNCVAILISKKLCSNENIFMKYNRESDVVIKNISVKRILTNDLLLRSTESGIKDKKISQVDVSERSPSYYEGTMTLESPKSLVFLNTFHPEWKLTMIRNGISETVSESNHFLVNGYANSWYLTQEPGEYKIKIEFMPQRRFYNGIKISVIGSVLLTVMFYLLSRRQKYD